jgi:hypothetical protein
MIWQNKVAKKTRKKHHRHGHVAEIQYEEREIKACSHKTRFLTHSQIFGVTEFNRLDKERRVATAEYVRHAVPFALDYVRLIEAKERARRTVRKKLECETRNFQAAACLPFGV